METITVDSTYHQFYVADAALEPKAPEEWSDQDVENKFNAKENIIAFCPQSDITAKIIVLKPNEIYSGNAPSFSVNCSIAIPSGRLGIFGWPWEKKVEFPVQPGKYIVNFLGYAPEPNDNGSEFYVLQFKST